MGVTSCMDRMVNEIREVSSRLPSSLPAPFFLSSACQAGARKAQAVLSHRGNRSRSELRQPLSDPFLCQLEAQLKRHILLEIGKRGP